MGRRNETAGVIAALGNKSWFYPESHCACIEKKGRIKKQHSVAKHCIAFSYQPAPGQDLCYKNQEENDEEDDELSGGSLALGDF